MANTKIITAKEYNQSCNGAGMQMLTESGAPRKAGFVLIDGEGAATWFKTYSEAEQEMINPTADAPRWINYEEGYDLGGFHMLSK